MMTALTLQADEHAFNYSQVSFSPTPLPFIAPQGEIKRCFLHVHTITYSSITHIPFLYRDCPPTQTNPPNLNELNNGHLGVVSLPGHRPKNARVAAVPVGVPLGRGLEEGVDEVLIVNPPEGLAAGVEVPPLPELDHVVDVLAHGLGTDGGGLDPAVADDLGGEGAEEGLALVGGLAELRHALPVSHHFEGGGFGRVGAGGGGGLHDGGDVGSGEGADGADPFICVAFVREFEGRPLVTHAHTNQTPQLGKLTTKIPTTTRACRH